MGRLAAPASLLLALGLGCDGGLQPEPGCPADICGTVSFRGAVPDSTDWVRVVVYATFPTSVNQLTAFVGLSETLPLGGDSTAYACCIFPLPPGPYAWVLVVWKKVGALSLATAPDLLREIGSYLDPADTTRFGIVVVPPTGGAGGIDIVADFARMRSVTDFLPATTRSTRQVAR